MYDRVDSQHVRRARAALAAQASACADEAESLGRLASGFDRWGLAPEAAEARAEARRLRVEGVILGARAAAARP